MQFRTTPALISAFALIAGTAFAHTYDPNKPVTLNGMVKKVEWNKPYVKIHLGVTDSRGKTKDWEIETAAPNVVEPEGLINTSIKEGDQITVQGIGAKNGSAHALARSLTLASGQTVAINAAPGGPIAQAPQAAPAAPAEQAGTSLPHTSTNWPLFGLGGIIALTGWAALSMARRMS